MNNLSFLNKYKLFIVDYDGTILDSMRMWRTLLSNFLNEEGIIYNEDIDEISKEQTNSETVKYMNEHYFPNMEYRDLENKMYQYVKQKYVLQKVKPNAVELLKQLKANGKVVLFSATATELLADSFNVNGLNKYFDFIYSASSMNTTKTNGVGCIEVLKREKIDIKDTLVVEDIYHAIKGARYQVFDTLAIYDNQEYWDEIKQISTYYINLNLKQ